MDKKDFLSIIGDFEISNSELPNYIRPVGVGVCNRLREAIEDKVSSTSFLKRDDNLTINGEELKWYGKHVYTKDGKFVAYLPGEHDYFAPMDLLSRDYLRKYVMAIYRNVIVSFRKDTDDTTPSKDERLTPKALLDPVEKVIQYPYYIDSAPLTSRDSGNGAISLLLYSIKPKKKPYIIIKNDKNGFIEGLLLWYGKEYSKALYIELSINTMFGKLSNDKYSLGIDFVSYCREKDGNWEMSKLFSDWVSREKRYPLNGDCRGELSNFFTNDLPLIKSAITDLKEDSNRVSKFTTWLVDKISQSSLYFIETYKEFYKFLENLCGAEAYAGFNESIQLLFSWKASFSKPVYTTDFSYYIPVGGDLKEEEDIYLLRHMPYNWANKDGKFSFTSSEPVQISEICKRHEGLSEKLFLEGFVWKDMDYWVEVLGKPTLINFKKVMDEMAGSIKLTIKDLEDGKFYVTEDITPEGIDRGKLFVKNRYLVKNGNSGKGSLSYIEGACEYCNESAYFYTLEKDLFNKVISVIKTEEVERNKYLLKKELYDKKDYVTFLKEIVWGTDDVSEIEDYNSYLEELDSDGSDVDIHGADFYSWELFLELFPKSLHEFFVDKNSSKEVKAQIKKLIPYESKYDPELDFRFVDPSGIPSKVTLSGPEDWKKIQKPDGVSIKVEFVLP